MFLPYHRLDTNPFTVDAVRPTLASHSVRQVTARLSELLEGNLHCLFISGPGGVGKSTVVRQCLDGSGHDEVSWVQPGIATREALLGQLMDDLGPGRVDASAAEMHRILEVYLSHQAGKGRHAVVVADALERLSVPVLRELEALAQLRFRYRSLLQLVMITRNDELVANLAPAPGGGRYAKATHQRLSGFTLDETHAYLRACLQGAGCEWPDELLAMDVITDIQAFTRGVVGDINALCREVLERLASLPAGHDRAPRVTRTLLKQAGEQLRMRYDPSAWEHAEGALSADAVQLSDRSTSVCHAAQLVVSSGGKVITEIALDRPRVVLGRDASCDISLDSSYVSRFQNLFMETNDGWLLIDLNSTNGCFVNGRRIRDHRLHDGDLIAVGQHQLRFVSSAGRDQANVPDSHGDHRNADTIVSPRSQVGRRA